MGKIKKVVSVLISILLWCIILLASLYAFVTLSTKDERKVASIAGVTPLTVQSDSMAPTFSAGDLIFIKKTDISKLKVGDVITFHTIIENEYALNTHRIESIAEENGVRYFTTKGDNNDIVDNHIIGENDVVGKYLFKVSKLGKVMDFLSSSVGFLVVIVLPILLFFIYQIYHLIMVSINLKRAIAAEEALENADRDSEADRKNAEADAKLEEARRLKEEAEALLAQHEASSKEEQGDE